MTIRLLIVSLVFMFLFMGAGAIQPYLTQYYETCGMGRAAAASALALVYFAFAVMRFFSGAAVHFTGIKRGVILGASTYLLFIILVTVFPSCAVAASAAVMWGLGAAFLWTAGSTYVLNISREGKYGFSAGVQRLFLQSGVIVGVIVLAELIHKKQNYGAGFRFAAAACAVGVALTFFLARTEHRPQRLNVSQALGNVFARRLVPLYIYLFTAGISYGIILNVFNRFIKDTYGFDRYKFTITLFYIAGGIFALIMGTVSDRRGRDLFITAAFGCGVAAAVIVLAAKGEAALAAASFLLGAMFQVVPTIVTAKIGDIAAPEERPGVVAGVFIWRDVGIAACIQVAGFFPATAPSLDRLLMIFIPLMLVAGVVSVFGALRKGTSAGETA